MLIHPTNLRRITCPQYTEATGMDLACDRDKPEVEVYEMLSVCIRLD